jgi:hypothetical protein
VHSEYLLVADIHIASERASQSDFPHLTFGFTGGDGLARRLGRDRGDGARQVTALPASGSTRGLPWQWVVVSEMVTHERALERSTEIARALAATASDALAASRACG